MLRGEEEKKGETNARRRFMALARSLADSPGTSSLLSNNRARMVTSNNIRLGIPVGNAAATAKIDFRDK